MTWDFDILKGDVVFTVLRVRRSISATPHEHHVSGAVGGIGSTQYISKHMTVGVDVSIIEPPLVCRDGDSIQVRRIQLFISHKYMTSQQEKGLPLSFLTGVHGINGLRFTRE